MVDRRAVSLCSSNARAFSRLTATNLARRCAPAGAVDVPAGEVIGVKLVTHTVAGCGVGDCRGSVHMRAGGQRTRPPELHCRALNLSWSLSGSNAPLSPCFIYYALQDGQTDLSLSPCLHLRTRIQTLSMFQSSRRAAQAASSRSLPVLVRHRISFPCFCASRARRGLVGRWSSVRAGGCNGE